MNLIEFSKKTHEEATDILESTGLLNLLEQFGDVRIGGSYYTDLMFGPDIDISVATNDIRESAVGFLNAVINEKQFQRYEYGDFESFPREKRPQAHIVVLVLPYMGRKWEIEIWFFNEHNHEQIDLEEKLKALPEDKRSEILSEKQKRESSGLDKHSLSSFEIYKKFV